MLKFYFIRSRSLYCTVSAVCDLIFLGDCISRLPLENFDLAGVGHSPTIELLVRKCAKFCSVLCSLIFYSTSLVRRSVILIFLFLDCKFDAVRSPDLRYNGVWHGSSSDKCKSSYVVCIYYIFLRRFPFCDCGFLDISLYSCLYSITIG